MMGPTLLQPPGGGSDPALAGRVADVEADIASLKSGKATTASVTAVSNRVKPLEDAAAAGHVSELVYLGTHAITSGIAFDRAALLAQPFLAGKTLARLRFDLQIVGGGASGCTFGTVSTSMGTGSIAAGGKPGAVRWHRGLKESDFVDGTAMQVGAGGVPRTGTGLSYGNAGGTTQFGWLTASGGRVYDSIFPGNFDMSGLSDVTLGMPGMITLAGIPTANFSSSSPEVDGRPSLGPGGGGGAANASSIVGRGAHSDQFNSRLATLRSNIDNGGSGASADAASFSYGTGGNAGKNTAAAGPNIAGGSGGFPGGGGGGVLWANDNGAVNPGSGRGGAGVIRIHCYELREMI